MAENRISTADPSTPYRLLLLGAGGQIGAELAAALQAHGGVRARLWCPRSCELNLADGPALREAVMRFAPRVIINAAAYTAVDKAQSEPELAHAVNARGPEVLAACALDLDALLVHYSTDYVFDGTATRPYREDDATAPLSVYGHSKLAGERAVLDSGAHAWVLRTAWVYGLHGRNFLLTVRRLALEGAALRIVEDQIGAPTWSRSIARATLEMLGSQAEPSPGFPGGRVGLYHMSCAGQTSWHGFACSILKMDPLLAALREREVAGIPSHDYPTPARRPAYSVLDSSRLARHFGITLPPWREALTEALALTEPPG